MESGTKLGHYEISTLLGKGGMGEVWRARDTKLGREVAIKTLPEEFARDADRLARFQREAKLLASLNHSKRISSIRGPTTMAALAMSSYGCYVYPRAAAGRRADGCLANVGYLCPNVCATIMPSARIENVVFAFMCLISRIQILSSHWPLRIERLPAASFLSEAGAFSVASISVMSGRGQGIGSIETGI